MDESCEWIKQTRLRKRSRKTCYYEEEEEGFTTGKMCAIQYSYNILDKIRDKRFLNNNGGTVLHFENGKNFSVQYLQTNGFNNPLIFHSPVGLDMKIPPHGFSVSDVETSIGPSRQIDVMDCLTQEALTMRLDQFCKYYKDNAAHRDRRLLNVISLEFSHTRLDPLIEPPRVVKELDWVNLVWPNDMVARQTDPTNDLRRMMYPKVQKYCLMSVAGCYTDFHLDFGGTSVWYHILEGEKIFFLVPPSEASYCRFEEWQKHGQQEKTFFPDLVEDCTLVHLKEGDTLLLPSGWIHGVYTPKQSLVFGGNFLNSFHITNQLKVSVMEKRLKVHDKFCYPFYSQIHWYVIEKYTQCFNELAKSKEHDYKRQQHHHQSEEYTYPPGKWVESVAIPKYPIDKFRYRPIDKTLLLPYLPQAEREGLSDLIKRMKGGLFLCDAPDNISNPHIVLSFLETQLFLRSLCSNHPNGITALGMIKCYNKGKDTLVKQSDSEVINIIEEFFSGEGKDIRQYENVGRANHMTVSPLLHPKQIRSSHKNGHGNLREEMDHSSQENNGVKLIEELMQTTFNDKPQSTITTATSSINIGVSGISDGVSGINSCVSGISSCVSGISSSVSGINSCVSDISDGISGISDGVSGIGTANNIPISLNMLSEFSPDQMMQFLNSEQKTIAQVPDHMTSTSDHMTHTSDHMTPTNIIPNIPNLTPDNMNNLLDQVSLLVLPGLNKASTEEDSIVKMVSSSLGLLSPISSSTPTLPFSTSATPTSSMTSLASPPAINRHLVSSINPDNSETSYKSLFHSIDSLRQQPSNNYPSLVQTTPPNPSLLPMTPPISSNTSIEQLPLTSGTYTNTNTTTTTTTTTKETKRRTSRIGGRKSRSNSKSLTRKTASRKSRCGKCEGCKRSPCSKCKFCLDSVRMGGFGKLKKACIQRRCSNMVQPRSSSTTSVESPNDSYKESLSLAKKELVKTIKTKESGHASMTTTTPTLDCNNPMVEVLSMGFGGNNDSNMVDTEGLVLHPESFGLSDASNGTTESPLIRLHDSYCQEDPLFNTSSIPTIHAQVLSSPMSSQLSAADLFPFSSHSSMSESDFTLHLSEDNV